MTTPADKPEIIEPDEWICHFCDHEFLLDEVFETADEFAICLDCKTKLLDKPKVELQ